jgi:hypothetical protein
LHAQELRLPRIAVEPPEHERGGTFGERVDERTEQV